MDSVTVQPIVCLTPRPITDSGRGHSNFRFGDDRVTPRFHLDGVETGRPVAVDRIDAATGVRLKLIDSATAGGGGRWRLDWSSSPTPFGSTST